MDFGVTTVFFDGRFWIALVERIGPDGKKLMGKHTFGPEPSNNDLLDFYLYVRHLIPLLESARTVRVPKRVTAVEQGRITKKSLGEFHALQTARLKEEKGERVREHRRLEEDIFELKQEKRKRKKRGH